MRIIPLADAAPEVPEALAVIALQADMLTPDGDYRPPTMAELIEVATSRGLLVDEDPGDPDWVPVELDDGTRWGYNLDPDEHPIEKAAFRRKTKQDHQNELVRRLKARRSRFYQRRYYPKRRRWRWKQ
jgi:hypothetical protein